MTYYSRPTWTPRPSVPAPSRAWAVSEKQISFLKDLCVKHIVPATIASFANTVRVGELKGQEMSRAIDLAKASPWAPRPEALFPEAVAQVVPVAAAAIKELVPCGFYFMDGTVYKVKPSKADPTHSRRYAYAFDTNGGNKGSYNYIKGAIYRLGMENKLTVAQAAAIGHATGVCCCCGRELTDPISVANGVGPICAAKYF